MSAHINFRDQILSLIFGFAAPYISPVISVGLSSNNPALSMIEPTDNSYARILTSPSDWELVNIPIPWRIQNAVKMVYPPATGDWGLINFFALLDENDDTVLLFDELVQTIDIAAGYEVWFEIGELSVALD